jgi:hypothetical protein
MPATMERTWSPNPFQLEARQYKAGFGWTQTDWHYQGDPRMNFRSDGWLSSTTSGFSAAAGFAPASDDMYAAQSNPKHDSIQDIDTRAAWWPRKAAQKTPENHFPSYSQGYEPSKSANDVAMRSLSEFGFIHAGAPWQTLIMFHDSDRYDGSASGPDEDPYKTADWRLLDYVELGDTPRKLNAFGQYETDGLINPNTKKRATIKALLTDIDALSQPNGLIDSLLANADEPFLKGSNVVDDPLFSGDGDTEFEKERLIGNVLSAVTTSSKTFTIYSVGEARSHGKTVSRVTLVTEIALEATSDGTTAQIQPKIVRQFVQ